MKNVFFGILTVILLIGSVGCNKDQRAVKRLNGEWESKSIAGIAIEKNSEFYQTMHFKECSLKDETFCNVTITTTEGPRTTNYKVTDKGETLVYINEEGEEEKLTIVSLEKDKLVLNVSVEDFGNVNIVYRKI